MSLLIKGMEMPKDIEPELVIEFADGIDGKRYAMLYHYRHGGLTEWLEAIPVPPHGRLIDADALLESIKEAKKKQPEISDVYDEDYFAVAEWVAYAPTIIESEGER